MNECKKSIAGFKKLKLKKEKRKKRKTPQNCKSPTKRQRFITTNVRKKQKSQKLN